jgi:putative heme-binding domain-containing protein
LLIQLAPDKAVPQTMRTLEASTSQRERIHYLHHLRHAKTGWTISDRKLYFRLLNEYDAFLGGRGLPQALARIRKEATASLTEKESQALTSVLDRKPKLPPLPDLSRRQFVRAWKPKDFADSLEADLSKRNLAAGQKVFHKAMCSRCHRKGSEGYPIGPDLTHVSRRFDRATLLTEILSPSQTIAENYQTTVLKLTDNRTLAGQVVPNLDYREPALQLAENPLHPDKLTKIPKSQILSQSHAPTSLMPQGLLNLFTKDEVLNLLTWLEAPSN